MIRILSLLIWTQQHDASTVYHKTLTTIQSKPTHLSVHDNHSDSVSIYAAFTFKMADVNMQVSAVLGHSEQLQRVSFRLAAFR